MAVNKTEATPSRKPAVPPAAIVAGLVLVAGFAGIYYLNEAAKRPAPPPPPLTGAAKAYLKYLRFVSANGQEAESPKMQAHESYMKQAVVEITGNLQNTGDRVLDVVEINCVFYDPYGQVVLRERKQIIGPKSGKLAPGEWKAFRLAFDTIPDSWNQTMPQMVIARIDFS